MNADRPILPRIAVTIRRRPLPVALLLGTLAAAGPVAAAEPPVQDLDALRRSALDYLHARLGGTGAQIEVNSVDPLEDLLNGVQFKVEQHRSAKPGHPCIG